ncbi:hypothetical protein [Gilvibacter sediminis]|uniref:hypothetical protein n=1 Tax=Gilvibacter sediminis TaxID=379071 RepID=UPI0023507CE8|nr:hypothetical protein [Gilvibacter sediminis]MDC7998110.1 hypothetical protein [Gilvibacter sediminis]
MNFVVVLVICLELIAAFAGLYHIKRHQVGTYTKYVVYVLFFVAFTEIIAYTIPILVDREVGFFAALKATPFADNLWIHNPQLIVTFGFFAAFFRSRLKRGFLATLIKWGVVAYVISAIANLIFTDIMFVGISNYTYIVGSIFLLICILIYYFELLKSDNILRFSTSLTFYISVGLLIYYLCITPLFIYGRYYYQFESGDAFNQFYLYTLAVANVIMYGTFTLGFILCKPQTNKFI